MLGEYLRGDLGQGGSHSPVTQFGLADPSPQAQSRLNSLVTLLCWNE